ncbi:MAG: L(+)-tartrate dehydratase subunit beta [Spirochaetaceae bacterium]|jgi:L(+)-tartrate dehydratase beta subunit|nr:L(+)-tartrate dehydratase subunit beta [Spirochaetaceae bacterium]
MNTWRLSTPLEEGDRAKLSAGDLVYLSGILVTGRDEVHHRVVRQKLASPVDLARGAIFHAGPIMGQDEPGVYRVISIGPTTSMRMEQCEAEFLTATGVQFIVGKGGMGNKTAKACQKLGAVYTVFPGGCAVLAADKVDAVEGVEWLDLGMPEAMWIMRVRDFGPLIVSIDTRGNNLFEDHRRLFIRRKEKILEELEKQGAFPG